MISIDWILYIVIYAAFFICAFYALTCVDFAKFCKIYNMTKVNLLVFMLSMSLAWMCTEAVMTLTIRRGF